MEEECNIERTHGVCECSQKRAFGNIVWSCLSSYTNQSPLRPHLELFCGGRDYMHYLW